MRGRLMNIFLKLAFLFFIGSLIGWVIELIFRKYFAVENKEHKWINPGFCVGPYLPLYGFGLCLLYLIASLEQYSIIKNPILNKAVLFVVMAVCMTAIEYIAGIFCLKFANVRLWDYSDKWGNIQGIICPSFSCAWALLGAVYYLLIHPRILSALTWLSENLAFSFFVGLFYGVFLIDVVYSSNLIMKLKAYAQENDVVVKYESLKAHIKQFEEKAAMRSHFFFPLKSERSLNEYLHEMRETFEKRTGNIKNKLKKS